MIMLKFIMAISGHNSKASLRNYIGHPSSEKIRVYSDILSDALSGMSHKSPQPSFAALSSRAIFMFRWIRLSFIQKTLALNRKFSTLSWKNPRVFMSHNGMSHKSPQPSFAALSSRAIFMFRWIRLSFIQKTLALNRKFSTLSWKNPRVFMSHNSAEVYWTFHFKMLY